MAAKRRRTMDSESDFGSESEEAAPIARPPRRARPQRGIYRVDSESDEDGPKLAGASPPGGDNDDGYNPEEEAEEVVEPADEAEEVGEYDEAAEHADGDEKPSFHVKLNVKKGKRDDDDEYVQEESSELEPDSEASSVDSLDGFIVDSDDNVVRRRRYRRQNRMKRLSTRNRNYRSRVMSDSEDDAPRRSLRRRPAVNYEIPPPPSLEEIAAAAATAASVKHRTGKANAGPLRRLFNVKGPFGGGDIVSLFNPGEPELTQLLNEPANADPAANSNIIGASGAGGSSADSDPLGIDTNIDFSAVGGLDDYIDKLKEMVSLPLMYPEVYAKFKITPPRGVLFHGPPGTGKTLMARALAASSSHEGKKITFFMRKGADCLSKWIGEAERQLRVLFDEAKAKQPSIIFFDEIDGLAPVRSSKQEQIHASIVSTLLALMDGMDNRGQVVVIGATNRPDSVDPALRRPGRFDREFYFPLPNEDARKKILEIHTSKWQPALQPSFIEQLATLTRGYGGADLRALCTEAALTAIQRRYPQIYMSQRKLQLNLDSIQVEPRDFLKSMERVVASSARGASSGPAALPGRVEPLLRKSFSAIKERLDALFPRQKKMTALEEAMYDGGENASSLVIQSQLQDLRAARIHRPRLLIHGKEGMGQQYFAQAVPNYLEGVHTSILDLSALYGNPSLTAEAALVQLIAEARRRMPSVLLVPNFELFFASTTASLQATFFTLLRSLTPTDKLLVVGVSSLPLHELDPHIVQFFGLSSGTQVAVSADTTPETLAKLFAPLRKYIESTPLQTRELQDCPKRVLEPLPLVPVDTSEEQSADEQQKGRDGLAQDKLDLKTRTQLKVKLGAIMDMFKNRYRRFRKPVIDEMALVYLFEPNADNLDQPYVLDDGMILEVATGRRFYNMDLDTIEDRLWNGFYCEPRQFLQDLEMIHDDSVASGDREKAHKSSEMLANAQVAIDDISSDTAFLQACRDLHRRVAQQMLDTLKAEPAEAEPAEAEPAEAEPAEGEPEESAALTGAPALGEPTQDVSMPDAGSELPKEEEEDADVVAESVLEVNGSDAKGVVETVNGHVGNDPEPEQYFTVEQTPTQAIAKPEPFILDTTQVSQFFADLERLAVSCSVDDLEMINASLVDAAWRHHHEWDRTAMLQDLQNQLKASIELVN